MSLCNFYYYYLIFCHVAFFAQNVIVQYEDTWADIHSKEPVSWKAVVLRRKNEIKALLHQAAATAVSEDDFSAAINSESETTSISISKPGVLCNRLCF